MTVRVSSVDGVAEVVLDVPERRNALGCAALQSIVAAVRQVESEGARAIVLSSTGPVFSAGADFSDLSGTSADVGFDDAVARTTAALRRTHLPVIAAVQGPCLGAAVDLVASADLVIAAAAARFEIPAVRLGILYNPEALAVMRRRITGALLRQLMLGVSVSADDAARGGLVGRVVGDGSARDVALDLAGQLCAAPAAALGATKELLNQLDSGTFQPTQWGPLRRCLLDTPERFEAVASRRPVTSTEALNAPGGAQP